MSIGALLLLLFSLGTLASCSHHDSPSVALYLAGAEVQAETDEQRTTVDKALSDMLTLSSDQLKNARYGPEQKTLPALLRSHVVPTAPVPVEDSDFFTQAADPKVRTAVEELRRNLKKEKY